LDHETKGVTRLAQNPSKPDGFLDKTSNHYLMKQSMSLSLSNDHSSTWIKDQTPVALTASRFILVSRIILVANKIEHSQERSGHLVE
jgi:hypothetical protein